MGGWWPHGFKERGEGDWKFPHEVWRGFGPTNFTFANDLPLLQLQVRKAAAASEVRTQPQRGICSCSGSQPFWGLSLGVCGLWRGLHGTQVPICLASETPSHLILPTLPASSSHKGNIQQAPRKSQVESDHQYTES